MDGQIRQRIGILFPPNEIFRESACTIIREFRQAFVQDDAIFKGRIHSLTIKRHDGMRGIANKGNLIFIRPRRTADRDE